MGAMADYLQKNKGYGTFKKREAEAEERRKNTVFRFYLPPEKGTKIVFLDDDPPIIEEHNLKINGSWKHWATCRRIIGESCPICEQTENRPYTVGLYTILDLSEWTDRSGHSHKNEKKLFAAKFKLLQQLTRHSEKRRERGENGLVGCVYDVYRSSSEAFNVGDTFDFEERLSEAEMKQLNPDITPFDYAQILEPPSAAQIQKLLSGTESQDTGGSSAEDDEFDTEETIKF